MLPIIEELDFHKIISQDYRRLLLISEGFEPRSLSFLKKCSEKKINFEKVILFENVPHRKSKKSELLDILKTTSNEIIEFQFFRYNPAVNENKLYKQLNNYFKDIEEIIIDISVMSKILIVILIYILRKYNGSLNIIYSEPENYAPSKEEFDKAHKNNLNIGSLPSSGVHDVVRTPFLTSSVMQDKPTVILCFTSFNERLVRSLLSDLNPVKLLLVLSVPPRITWHTKATMSLHLEIINEYSNDNILNDEDGLLSRRASTLDYRETFLILEELYRKFCYTNRIIISPTGSKMQAVAVGLIKSCCPDIHIEYPTPESFLLDGYSTSEIYKIHRIKFDDYSNMLEAIGNHHKLNG